MKRLVLLLLALVTVISMVACGSSKKEDGNETEEETEETPVSIPYSIECFREEISAKEALFGVAYLGSYDPSAEILIEFLNKQDYWSQMLFLENVDPEKICKVDFGYELYTVLPLEGVNVTVYKTVLGEDGNINKGEELLKVEGEPFFLNGNVSEIFPDFLIVAEKDGKTVEYTPMLSGMDGKLVSNVDGVYDITPYEQMGDFIYSEQTEAN